jgi:hypothetical protein
MHLRRQVALQTLVAEDHLERALETEAQANPNPSPNPGTATAHRWQSRGPPQRISPPSLRSQAHAACMAATGGAAPSGQGGKASPAVPSAAPEALGLEAAQGSAPLLPSVERGAVREEAAAVEERAVREEAAAVAAAQGVAHSLAAVRCGYVAAGSTHHHHCVLSASGAYVYRPLQGTLQGSRAPQGDHQRPL